MRFFIPILALAATTFALPSADGPLAMVSRFVQSDECQLPETPAACSGATQKDVIIQYGKNTTQAEKDLFLNAAKASGATIHGVINNFGFAAFIPESVVTLMAAHGATCGLKIYNNGCAGIPWCGEAPC